MRAASGSSIRRLRQRRGWTQRQLAEHLGTDPVTISRWERGATKPRRSARARLAALTTDSGERSLEPLIDALGRRFAARTLRRALLLARPPGRAWFAANPAKRLRDVDRAVADQLALRGRFHG